MPKKSRRKRGNGARSGGAELSRTTVRELRGLAAATASAGSTGTGMPRELCMNPHMARILAGANEDGSDDDDDARPCGNPRCDRPASSTFPCPVCKVAEYCSGACRRAHRREHGSAECGELLSERNEEVRRATEEMAGPHRERWLANRIPFLDNMTPTEAARTPEGRVLLEKLMTFYDENTNKLGGDIGMININPDREWAARRLNLPDPTNLTIGPPDEKELAPAKFGTDDRVVIGENDVAPSIAGTLGYVAHLSQLQYPPKRGEAAIFVYGYKDAFFLPEEVLTKAGSTTHPSVKEPSLIGSTLDFRIGDVALITGIQNDKFAWINGLEGVVCSLSHAALGRYGVDLAGVDGSLTRKSIKSSNLELLFRPNPYLIAPPLPDRRELDIYAFTERGEITETGSLRWYAADVQADAVISGQGNHNPNDMQIHFDMASDLPVSKEEDSRDYFNADSERFATTAIKALKTFRFHADSYSLLGKCFFEGPSKMRCETTAHIMYLRAIECVKMLHPKIESGVEIKWEHVHTRPYIRARQGLATLFARMGHYSKAVQEGQRLLAVNRSNTKIKIEIVHWLISEGSSRLAEDFLCSQCSGDNAFDVGMAYARVLMNFCKYQVLNDDFVSEDWHPALQASLRSAQNLNSFVPEYLLSPNDHQASITSYSMGSREEAIHYAQLSRKAWRVTLGALDWLSSVTDAPALSLSNTPDRPAQELPPEYSHVRASSDEEPSAVDCRSDERENSPEISVLESDTVASFQSMTVDASETKEAKLPSHGKKPAPVDNDWFHAVRDDPIFAEALGEWGEKKVLNTSSVQFTGSSEKNPSNKQTIDGLDAKSKLQIRCQKEYQSPPTYLLVSEDDVGCNEKIFVSKVFHEKDDRIKGVGSGSSKKKSETEAAKDALANLEMTNTPELFENIRLSFRAAATPLPFAVRFQLERCIMSPDFVRIKKQPKGKRRDQESTKEATIELARTMLRVFITRVVPPLLSAMPPSNANSNETTLSELFAQEIWSPLCQVKEAISKQMTVRFDGAVVSGALKRARDILEKTQLRLGTTESELASLDNDISFEMTKMRAKWPMAEYRCKFSACGRLIPTGYEMINTCLDLVSTKITSQSRRVMRESGWHVRDRFLLIKELSFQEPYATETTAWLASKPTLCNRQYEYLFDKGTGRPDCWLFSPDERGPSGFQTRQKLLETLGDFTNVKETKVGDRIGLAFTQTIPLTKLAEDQIIPIPEVIANGYKFSDGCGVMGAGIATRAKEAFGLATVPGAIQIRLGGIKGMLSLKDGFPPNKIGIRPSMVKFPSNHRVLEAKRCARAKNEGNKLFSQILLILDHLGVPDLVFYDLQEKACAEYALQFDKRGLQFEPKTHHPIECEYIRKVLKDGLKTNGEPFSSHEMKEIKSLMNLSKNKANLRCSLSLMLGVIDEHDFLEEGQVLVGNGRIKGPVLVCRSPCNFPGDIQRAEAVAGRDDVSFPHLSEVIVFSAKGSRPLPDMLSGGDLDGDEYYIISESSIVEKVCPATPHDYGSQSEQLEAKVHIENVLKTSCTKAPDHNRQLGVLQNYMSLGNLVSESADAWIRVADVEGAASEDATRMGNMHQCSLDARKGAVKVNPQEVNHMRKVLSTYGIPRWKCNSSSGYDSASIQGVLYDFWCSWLMDFELLKLRHGPLAQIATVSEHEARNNDRKKRANEALKRREKEKKERIKTGLGKTGTEAQCFKCSSSKSITRCRTCNDCWHCKRHQVDHEQICSHAEAENVEGTPENPATESVNDMCAFCLGKALISCPRSDTCNRTYCDTECAGLDWLSGHGTECGPAEKCPICLDPMSRPFSLLCDHKICQSCLKHLLQGGYGDKDQSVDAHEEPEQVCPICRSSSLGYMAAGGSLTIAQGSELLQKHSLLLDQELSRYIDSKKALKVLEKVIELFRKAINNHPDVRFVHCNLGSALMELALMQQDPAIRSGQLTEATQMLCEAIKRETQDSKANYTLGQILLIQSNPAEAIAPLRRALKTFLLLSRFAGNSLDEADDAILNDYRKALRSALGQETPFGPSLRFRVGDRVLCNCSGGWMPGFVSKLWFREKEWPEERNSLPYQVLLDDDNYIDNYIFVPYDDDVYVKRASC